MKLTFRFATAEDNNFFYDSVLTEKNKVSRQLGLFGKDNDFFSTTEYKSCIVAELEGKRVAFAKVNGAQLTGFNYISFFYVIPQQRKKGIGTQLFQFVENYAFNNYHAVGVDLVTIDNKPMDTFLKKLGFSFSGSYKKNYCINGKYYSQSRWVKTYKKYVSKGGDKNV